MSFEEIKKLVDSDNPEQRQRGIESLLQHYLSPDNQMLHRIAMREFFNQLRPLYTVEDVVSRAVVKIEKRLRKGTLKLINEKKFLSFVTQTIRLILLDLNTRKQLPTQPQGDESRTGGLDPADPRKGPRTAHLDADSSARLQAMLEELLPTDQWYLIRRHYFENATYEQLADEVLPPAPEPITNEVKKNRSDRIRMRIQRIREELKQREEDLLPYLES